MRSTVATLRPPERNSLQIKRILSQAQGFDCKIIPEGVLRLKRSIVNTPMVSGASYEI